MRSRVRTDGDFAPDSCAASVGCEVAAAFASCADMTSPDPSATGLPVPSPWPSAWLSADVRTRCHPRPALASPSLTVQPLANPRLDDRLTGDAQPLGLTIQGLDHPHREVDVHPANLPMGTSSAVNLNRVENVDITSVEGLVELMRLHTAPPLVVVPGVPK